jgi:hypothetical protein
MSRRPPRDGFTIVEASVAAAFAALAGSTLVMATLSALQTTHNAQDQTMALGMAQQLMDEVLGNPYLPDSGNPYATPIGPDKSEVGPTRQLFNDIGDYNGYRCQPPQDFWGVALGSDNGQGGQRDPNFQAPAGLFANWQQQVDIYYVSQSNLTTPLSGSKTSDYRVVEVRIIYIDPITGQTNQLASLQRVIAYVAPPP